MQISHLNAAVAEQQRQDRIADAAAARRARAVAHASGDETVTIRLARADEAPALERLAELDSASRWPQNGPVLVAEVDGRLAAARPLGGREVVSDPFRPSNHLVALLEVRARQLAA